jgi:malate dehydrogenase (oxaloacetate-decarboxylating)(NADP+)
MSKNDLKEATFAYHRQSPPGKFGMKATKPCRTQRDLSLAYTPGVAAPCLEIQANPEAVWDYTARGNMVAVISDGTAVLGLGNIGPAAGIPVMEGKCVLFKRFADIDAIPLCLHKVFTAQGKTDPAKIISVIETLEPSLGGINLEDIAGPACFEVEQELKRRMGIPVFHDDQHGTAIISLAGVLNAIKLTGRRIEDSRFVVNGAGAAGIACIEFYIAAGARRENVIICDSKGVVYRGRKDGMTPEKEKLASDTPARTLAEAMCGADLFLGLSVADCVTADMVRAMAPQPIIFAMANPNPEIYPAEATAAGAAVVCTGRSDFPNQVNNVLGFPGIFRGALDTRARTINEEMKAAASRGLAELACETIPADVLAYLTEAYPEDAKNGVFAGANPLKTSYVIPKPFDPRVVPRVARHVAEAAMKSGVAAKPIADLDAYERSVRARVDATLKA